MTITAKYPGKCVACGLPIPVGSQIEWTKGEGARHANCTETAAPVVAAAYPPTEEQQAAVTLARTGQSIAIQAGAGTGKTSTLALIARDAPQKRFQFVAFNRSIVRDAGQKFPANVTCSTAHSLAYRAVGAKYQAKLQNARRMKSSEIAAILRVEPIRFEHAGVGGTPKALSSEFLAGLALKAVTRFCQSAEQEPQATHVPLVDGLDAPGEYTLNNAVSRHLLPYVRRAWADLMNLDGGKLAWSKSAGHGYYLKAWQLSGPRIQADVILFDEAQDANPVMVAIVAAQTHAQLVFVGDSQQQIYSFTGAVNALASVPADAQTYLTKSFRFGPRIAEVANAVLDMLDAELRIVGWDQISSTVGPVAEPDAILCRTNATAVREVMSAQAAGQRPHLVGGGDEVVRFAKAAKDLMDGYPTDHPELACFDTWGEVQTYVDEDEQGGELKLLVKLVDDFGVATILAALDRMIDERTADIVISTAHKAKGREWDAVQLAGDFPDQAADEELRLLYVAVTRAKRELDVTAVATLEGGQRWKVN